MNALDLASTLTADGSPFVLATVVRCENPTSAKPGQKAVILPDGTMHGWVGGSCAQPLVAREALLALADGQPRLMRLCPSAGDAASLPGLVEHRMTCHSGGTLEIFVEPMLPKPALCIVGDSPVASVLAALGPIVGYRVHHIDAAFDGIAGRSGTGLAGEAGTRSSVIVATMG
ncbi:MAG: XdhC family protein, partial [Chloroflexota bacterium]